MADEIDKWSAPATNGDVARAIIDVRVCMSDLFSAIVQIQRGNSEQAIEKLQQFIEHDEELKNLVAEIADFDSIAGSD